jgi:hypothetical protein
MACSAMDWEVGSGVCKLATPTSMMRFPRTVTFTDITPKPYCSRGPTADRKAPEDVPGAGLVVVPRPEPGTDDVVPEECEPPPAARMTELGRLEWSATTAVAPTAAAATAMRARLTILLACLLPGPAGCDECSATCSQRVHLLVDRLGRNTDLLGQVHEVRYEGLGS